MHHCCAQFGRREEAVVQQVLELEGKGLDLDPGLATEGASVLAAILHAAESTLAQLKGRFQTPAAALGRIRGTGRGVSFSGLVDRLEADHPLEVRYPFEGSDHVGGAVWRGDQLVAPACHNALAKLHWKANARDLPMHAHEHSDRFIIVLEGRGYFHVTDEPLDAFTSTAVRAVPARERDVFAFTRGVVHTFSTMDHGMTLLSCQLPFLPFDDPRQYTLPEVRWTAAEHPIDRGAEVTIDPSWLMVCTQKILSEAAPRTS